MTASESRAASKVLVAIFLVDVMLYVSVATAMGIAEAFLMVAATAYVAFLCWVVTLPDPKKDRDAWEYRSRP